MEEQIMKTEKKNKLFTTKKGKPPKELWKVSFLRPISLLIGNCKFHATNDGEIIVKCFFAKKQLVWEILINGCIEKIEIDWSNIIGMKASLNESEPGILELELSHPPKFFRRRDSVNPREHSQWDDGLDFTEGKQASNCRRHLVMFPPGMLNQHFVKLLKSDYRLLELSQKPYPTNNNPYFFSQTLLSAEAAVSLPSFQPNYNQTHQLPHAALNLILQESVDALPSYSNYMLAPTNVYLQSSSSVDNHDIGCSNGNMSMMNNMEALQVTSNNTISNNGQMEYFNNEVSSNNDFSNWAISTYGIDNSNINCVTNGRSMMNIDEPTCSNGVSSDYLLNNVNLESSSSMYFPGVSSSFFSNWPTDPNGVWKPFGHEPRKNTKGSKNCLQSNIIE